jgi:nitrite reductase/ring-hydroxylating ferredoxin subunit
MQHAEQVRIVKELLARLDTGTNVDAGGFRRNPTSVYVDPEMAEREWQEFFRGHPQVIGLSGDLPEPGSFLRVDDLGVPILATRDADGHFRAMVNSCRHRGAIVQTERRGTTRRHTCAFHRWSYATNGELAGIPEPDHFGEVDTACLGLTPLPAVEHNGLLWVHPDPDGSVDVEALLGPELDAQLAGFGFGEMDYFHFDDYDVACNWKLAMDTFGETYHFSALHSETINLFMHGNVQCYDTFGRNPRMILCRREIDQMRHLEEDRSDIRTASLPVYWLFPNVQLMPSQEGAYPVSGEPGRHISRITFYLRPDTSIRGDLATQEIQLQMAQGFADIIRDEDYAMSAGQQYSAETRGITHTVFGRNEPALHHYHNTYRAALGMDLLPLLDEDDLRTELHV